MKKRVDKILKDHINGKSCKYGCTPSTPSKCSKCDDKKCTNRITKR